jgi:hypothetical protein
VIVLAETTASPDAHPALRQHIAEATIGILEAPPEEIVLVAPRTLPKTASGKLRRAAACQLYEAGGLGQRRSVPRQILGLWLAAALPALRRRLHAAAAFLYACYWWAVIALLAPLTWLLVIILPEAGMALDGAAVCRTVGVLAGRRPDRHRPARRATGQCGYRQQPC